MGDRRRSNTSIASSTGGSPKMGEVTLPLAVDNVKDSVKFFGCCLIASTSVILHSRRLLPEKHFRKMSVHGLKSMILKTDDAIGNRVINKLRGVNEALAKGYLDEFMIVVCDDRDDPDSVTELYTWEFSYLPSGTPTANFTDGKGNKIVSVTYRGIDHIKNQLTILLGKLVKLCRSVLEPIDEGCYAGLRVTYTDCRPDDYHAPGFMSSQTLYKLRKDVRPVPLFHDGMASKCHGAFLRVSSSFLPRQSEAVTIAQINGEKLESSFSEFDIPQPLERGDDVPQKDESFLPSGSNNSHGDDLEVTRLDTRSCESDPVVASDIRLKILVNKGQVQAKSPLLPTCTSGTTVPPADEVLEESSLMGSNKTRSSMSDFSMKSTDVSTNLAKKGRPSRTSIVAETPRAKKPRKSTDDDNTMTPVAFSTPKSSSDRRHSKK